MYSIASINGGGKSTLLQFIFILLHSFIDEDRKIYIKNLLSDYIALDTEEQTSPLVSFEVEHKNELFYLNFSIENSITNKWKGNFNLFLDVEDTKRNIELQERSVQEYERVNSLLFELDRAERITPNIRSNIRFITRFIKSEREQNLFEKAQRSNDVTLYRELFQIILQRNSHLHNSINELQNIYGHIQEDLATLKHKITVSDTQYITHISNDNVLLLETNTSNDLLKELSNKVYLTAPMSQIFLFLSQEDKDSIFNEFSDHENDLFSNSYNDCVRRAKNDLSGFFTYDFASTELILKSFKKASEEDLKSKRSTGQYGSNYDELTNELKDFLDGKEISENEDGNKVIFKLKNKDEELSPEDLSHGELKKLGIYIWLKYIVGDDTIILMDEVDIALHPKWQYELVKNFTRWAKKSQFLLATHSPQILSSTYYKNLIKLENGKVTRFSKPPLDRDINAIITQIMEAPDFPEELLELHKKYRKLINDGKIESQEAHNLKEKILEYESKDSSFFQEINFELELI